jgi:1,4-dihydroxy-2-naphthoate octaprenyltransferase
MKKFWYFILETRAGILSTTILPVALGSSLAYYLEKTFSPIIFWLVLAGYCLVHIGSNIINDYFDAKDGTDNVNTGFIAPFSGGGRLLQDGKLSPPEILGEAILIFTAAAVLFAVVSLKAGPMALLPAVLGMLSGIFYSAPPFKISRTGFGEMLVAAVFGPIITLGAFCAQAKTLNILSAVISLPLGLLTAAFVITAEFPDSEADGKTGKRNLIVRLGKKRGVLLFGAVSMLAYAVETAGLFCGYIPAAGLWVLAGMPFSIIAFIELLRKHNMPAKLGLACAMALIAHFISGAALAAVFFR